MSRVTVILTVSDEAASLETTLSTLRRQFDDPDDLQLIAVDDGAPHGTGERLRTHAEQFMNVELMRNERSVGIASARNQGIDAAQGDYLCFVDGDVWLQPLRLQALAHSMKSLRLDFLRTDHVAVTDGGRRLVRAPYPWRGVVCPPRDGILPLDEPTLVDAPHAWTGMYHRRLFDDGLASFAPGLHTAADQPWIWRLHLAAGSFALVDAPAVLRAYRRVTEPADELLRALTLTRDVVAADRDGERYLPKLAATALALAAERLRGAAHTPRAERRRARAQIDELLQTMPRAALGRALAVTAPHRRRLLVASLGLAT